MARAPLRFHPPGDFDEGCARFTAACQHAADWKQRYAGAAYASRIRLAVAELEAAIADAKRTILTD